MVHVIRMSTHGFHKPPFQRSHHPSRRSLSEAESMSGHPNVSVVALFFCHCPLCIFMSHHTLHFTCRIVFKRKKDCVISPSFVVEFHRFCMPLQVAVVRFSVPFVCSSLDCTRSALKICSKKVTLICKKPCFQL